MRWSILTIIDTFIYVSVLTGVSIVGSSMYRIETEGEVTMGNSTRGR